jgi:hypothetical protein
MANSSPSLRATRSAPSRPHNASGQPKARFGFNTGTGQDYDPPEIVPIEVDYGATVGWSPDGRSIAHESDGHDELSRSVDIYKPFDRGNHRVINTDGACCGYADVTDVNFGPTGVLSVSSKLRRRLPHVRGHTVRATRRIPRGRLHLRPVLRGTVRTVTVFVSQVGDKGLVASPTGPKFVKITGRNGAKQVTTLTVPAPATPPGPHG